LFDSGYRIEHAHNEWLEWATEGGLPFAMIWTWIIARALRSLRLWNLGISAVAAHSLVDFPTARLGVSVWLFLLIGLTEEARWPNRNLQRRE
jgi:O-antigen ligase